jgi:hypothetical protein
LEKKNVSAENYDEIRRLDGIRSTAINWRPGKFSYKILMIQSHEGNIKPFSAAEGFL